MKGRLTAIVLMAVSMACGAQVREFGEADEGLTAFRGDTIIIRADTASVVSARVTGQLNANLDEYRALRIRYREVIDSNTLMIGYLRSVQQSIQRVINNQESGQLQLDELREVAEGLVEITGDLDQNNAMMGAVNEDLELRIQELEAENDKLKAQIRHLWFDGVTDKLITGGLGVAIGVVLVLVLGGG